MHISRITYAGNKALNRVSYIFFVLAAIISISYQNLTNGGMLLGIALLFDPFDYTVKFSGKSITQKSILIIQALAVLVVMLLEFII